MVQRQVLPQAPSRGKNRWAAKAIRLVNDDLNYIQIVLLAGYTVAHVRIEKGVATTPQFVTGAAVTHAADWVFRPYSAPKFPVLRAEPIDITPNGVIVTINAEILWLRILSVVAPTQPVYDAPSKAKPDTFYGIKPITPRKR